MNRARKSPSRPPPARPHLAWAWPPRGPASQTGRAIELGHPPIRRRQPGTGTGSSGLGLRSGPVIDSYTKPRPRNKPVADLLPFPSLPFPRRHDTQLAWQHCVCSARAALLLLFSYRSRSPGPLSCALARHGRRHAAGDVAAGSTEGGRAPAASQRIRYDRGPQRRPRLARLLSSA